MGQAIGVVRIRLVRCHVEGGLGVACIDADRRQPLGAKRMVEPPRSGDLQNLHHTTHRSGAKPLILQQPVSTDSLVLVSKKRVCDRTL
jgi:hypothetical protein